VNPLLLVSTVAPLIVAVFTLLAAAAAGLLLLLLLEDEGEVAVELHAARAAVAAAATGSASRIRGRFSASSRVSDRIITYSLAAWMSSRALRLATLTSPP
jgi:hypothetical protein